MEETPTGSTVFVVHGRNLALRDSLFSFLRALKLDPREWEEWVRGTGSGAPYVGEVLDHAFNTATAAVVLLTPDDEAQLRDQFRKSNEPSYETQLTGQARPNVLFEAGMAFGRQPARTILVEVGNLRPFSDIGGRLAIRLDNSAEKRNELATRLESAGCKVVRSGNEWLQTGDFSLDAQPSALTYASGPRPTGHSPVIIIKSDPEGSYARLRVTNLGGRAEFRANAQVVKEGTLVGSPWPVRWRRSTERDMVLHKNGSEILDLAAAHRRHAIGIYFLGDDEQESDWPVTVTFYTAAMRNTGQSEAQERFLGAESTQTVIRITVTSDPPMEEPYEKDWLLTRHDGEWNVTEPSLELSELIT